MRSAERASAIRSDEFNLQEETAQLNKALQSLSPIQRRVLLLRYYGQMSFAEIAAETGCRSEHGFEPLPPRFGNAPHVVGGGVEFVVGTQSTLNGRT